MHSSTLPCNYKITSIIQPGSSVSPFFISIWQKPLPLTEKNNILVIDQPAEENYAR